MNWSPGLPLAGEGGPGPTSRDPMMLVLTLITSVVARGKDKSGV
jgi:hypothetical protein